MKHKKIVAIIQARMSSTRLPGKVLKKIGKKTILEILIDRIKNSKRINSILIATTKKKQDDKIVDIARKLCVAYFKGSEDNVLKRFIDASRNVGADVIVRITADNPLTDPILMDKLIDRHINNNADYTYCPDASLGISPEIVNKQILEKIYPLANNWEYREHVTFYILDHPYDFKIQSVKAAALGLNYPHLRLTVDTASDLRVLRRISRALGNLETLKIKKVIRFLREHPKILKINAKAKQKIPKIKKKVTVIIRTHNSQKFVGRAIDSVLNQDIPPRYYEILVVDDGSADGTKQIIRFYGERIRLIEEQNLGYVKAINHGVTNAQGEHIMLLDADDTFEPNIISEMSKTLENEKDLGFVYCDYYERDLENNKMKVISLKNIFNSLAGGIMYRKDVLKEVGMYDENLIFPEYDLLIKVMKICKGKHIPKPLFNYYRHQGSLTANKERVRLGRTQLFAKYGIIKGLRDY